MIRKKNINKKAIFIVIIFIILFALYGIYQYKEGKKEQANKVSEKLLSDKKYQDMILKNIILNELEENIILTAQITNESAEFHDKEYANIVFLDNKANVICQVETEVPSIGASNTSNMQIIAEKKCKNAYTFVIEKIEREGIS